MGRNTRAAVRRVGARRGSLRRGRGGDEQARPSGPGLRVRALRAIAGERGAETAEYAIATMAAVGFAGLLVVILKGDEVREILTALIRDALTP